MHQFRDLSLSKFECIWDRCTFLNASPNLFSSYQFLLLKLSETEKEKEAMEYAHKPHAVCVPYPAQGHINPMLKLAKLLHFRGFHITFVNTEYNHHRLIKSRGPAAVAGLSDFKFEAIPDGLPPPPDGGGDSTQDTSSVCDAISNNTFFQPFLNLLHKLNSNSSSSSEDQFVPPVTCIVSDCSMIFTVKAGEELGNIPVVFLWTCSGCGSLGHLLLPELIQRGILPLKDEKHLTSEYLDTTLDWIPGVEKIRLKDLPSFILTTNADDVIFKLILKIVEATPKASACIFNTFDSLEQNALKAISPINSQSYPVGPLHLLSDQITDEKLRLIGSNLWKEESDCLKWLNTKPPNSVIYVNFGSITVMSREHLIEFALGLANSQKHFLWIIRPDLVSGDSAVLPTEFVMETEDRGKLASWCNQEEVLSHSSVGGFLTHSGWNSTLESICSGVPMICWPFFAEQRMNCRYTCVEWGIGMEMNSDVKRDEVEELVRELFEGEKGKEMRKKAMELKVKAVEASRIGGSSYKNLDKVIDEVLLSKCKKI